MSDVLITGIWDQKSMHVHGKANNFPKIPSPAFTLTCQ